MALHPLKMLELKWLASSQAGPATSGALQNITASLLPTLHAYAVTTITHITRVFAGPNKYLESTGASISAIYSTVIGAIVLVVPILMSRYGWPSPRDGLSPFASQTSIQDGPHVTDDDFSYITSDDLRDSLRAPERVYDSHSRRAPRNATVVEEDDVLLIKMKGVTYAERFPAYSISDGRLTVRDVRDRAALLMDLSSRRASRIKMLYKGRNLKEYDIPIRDYGVKNNSELLVVIPDGKFSDDEDSTAAEDALVGDLRDDARTTTTTKKKKNKNGKKKPKNRGPRETTTNLEVPGQAEDSKWASPDPSRHPSRVPSPAVSSGALDKLEAIRSHFDAVLLPDCESFIRHPPPDAKTLEFEHRKISETVLQHVLLKLDEVDTGGDPDIRARRRDLVNYVQGILNDVDAKLPAGVKPNR
ncbi:BAG domain-containing protein [Xylaria sp. CBS 124048]|nr:BAG domain-containing protein [Xylaria sp. CBS 124048]